MTIKNLTTEQIAGQRIIAGFEGTDLNADLKYLIGELKVGGIILFSINIETPDQVKNLCEKARLYATKCDQPPLIIAVDQEGGQVARLKAPFTIHPGNPFIKNRRDAIKFAKTTANELKSVGINMNMAPVLDVAPEEINSIMSERSFGHDPLVVSKLGSMVIEVLQQNRIMAVAKHFPGIGRTIKDSHLDMPSLDVDIDSLESFDLVPFKDAFQNNASACMLSHIRYNKIDDKWPASLSVKIAGDLLRKKLGYNGVVMTDDIDMGAIKKHFDLETVIARIIEADIDIALICHKGPDIGKAFEEICRLSKGDQRVHEKSLLSVNRILELKRRFLY